MKTEAEAMWAFVPQSAARVSIVSWTIMSWLLGEPLAPWGAVQRAKVSFLWGGGQCTAGPHTHRVGQPWVDGLRVSRRRGGWS